jgi:fructose-1,6-bisphosphatase I
MNALHPVPTHTLSRFILAQQRLYPKSTGELSDLLSSIGLGIKIISSLIATSGFKGLTGYTGRTNVQGEAVRQLDEEADQTLIELLGASGHFGLMVSEEQNTVVPAGRSSDQAKYVVAFDPLDGSSNIGSNIPVGTIFSILRRRTKGAECGVDDFLQSGRHVVAAGYAVYGAKTSFVYSSGQGVHGFTLDPSIGEFVLTEEQIHMPERGSTYSVNEGRSGQWSPGVRSFVNELKEKGDAKGNPYSARYVGSLVADFDRNLRQGGVFLYPPDAKNPHGKLRLLYECIPLGFIAEQAGAIATDGSIPILDRQPVDIHERTIFMTGGRYEMGRLAEHCKKVG